MNELKETPAHQNTLTHQGPLWWRIDIRHGIQVEVEKAIECHELGWGVIVRRELRHKVVLQNSYPEPQDGDRQAHTQHDEH